jgi:hypothetical protein
MREDRHAREMMTEKCDRRRRQHNRDHGQRRNRNGRCGANRAARCQMPRSGLLWLFPSFLLLLLLLSLRQLLSAFGLRQRFSSYGSARPHCSREASAGRRMLVLCPQRRHSYATKPGSPVPGGIVTTPFITVPHRAHTGPACPLERVRLLSDLMPAILFVPQIS